MMQHRNRGRHNHPLLGINIYFVGDVRMMHRNQSGFVVSNYNLEMLFST